jgi:hypothetical protein
MKFRTNKTTPIPVSRDLSGNQPLGTKVKLDPVLLDLVGNVKEKKFDGSNRMTISD